MYVGWLMFTILATQFKFSTTAIYVMRDYNGVHNVLSNLIHQAEQVPNVTP